MNDGTPAEWPVIPGIELEVRIPRKRVGILSLFIEHFPCENMAESMGKGRRRCQ